MVLHFSLQAERNLLNFVVEQNEKGTWDQKHWEDLMLKVMFFQSELHPTIVCIQLVSTPISISTT